MKVTCTLALLSFLVLGASSARAQSESPWDDFLQHPDDRNLTKLTDTNRSDRRCPAGVAPRSDQEKDLFKLIREGNERALRAALLVSSCWDGADTEDFYWSAGMFLQRDPRSFLEVAAKSDVSIRQLSGMATMLPLEVVDKIDARLKAVEVRISRLEAVDDPELTIVKMVALAALTQYKVELTEQKKELLKEGSSPHR